MAKQFNVPPVVFPSGANPAAPSAGPQQRRLPTAPFQPPNPQTPASRSSRSTSTRPLHPPPSLLLLSSHPQSVAEEEPLGSRMSHRSLKNSASIPSKSIKKLSQFSTLSESTTIFTKMPISGPFLFLMAFGLFQLLAGKLHFGIILGWVTMASMFLYVVFNMLAGKNGNLDMYKCLSLIGYCMLPIVMLSAFSLFVPQGGMVIMVITGLFVIWSTRVCTGLVVELANCGDEHRGLITYACFLIYMLFSLLVIF
ncbi:UNVERIFIED_CONTAM: protein YIPF5 [Sesamum calycinum]|uniref:Protein YIP n=1 Tax=Sesamum calycinum TaxID=2727403 RepID=A0AAW2LSH1_9LAMI